MTPEQFVYWLQGFLEIGDPSELDEKQTQIVKDHLNLVFDKQTPNRKVEVKTLEENFKPIKPNRPTVYCSSGGLDNRKLC